MFSALVVAAIGAQQESTEGAPRPSGFGLDPGPAKTRAAKGVFEVGNRSISATWQIANGHLRMTSLRDLIGQRSLAIPDEVFVITLEGGQSLSSSHLQITEGPRIISTPVSTRASKYADRLPGVQIVAKLRDAENTVGLTWRAILRDGSGYIRQELTLAPTARDMPASQITLMDLPAPSADAHIVGSVQGSPAVAAGVYFGVEHPMSTCAIQSARIHCALARTVPIQQGQSFTVSSVIGVAPPGQMRRSFLQYLERERAHPYRTFLHYNSWYDIGYFTPYDEAAVLNVIDAFGAELVQKRGAKMDSFLLDDGWDDQKSLWSFNSGFPQGLARVEERAAKHGAAAGVWLSPWGGYGKPRDERLAYGKQQGFETNARGFALSGPVYYKRFRDVCLTMIREFGVNQFKFDGIGRATGTVAGSEFGSDFEAAIHLIGELRGAKPDLFVNLTTGTWPSPFWLQYADSIWRGGEDHDFAGVGSWRQKWITYRDADTFKNIVNGGPLYPLNSLMLHGLIYARHAKNLDTDPSGDFASEVRSYFGTGTQLEEMYVTPGLLSQDDWNVIAETAKWARQNADVLVDTHWIGGDPAKLEVYGWAAWSPDRATLVLRNPSDQPASFQVDIAHALELPPGAPAQWRALSPWAADARKLSLTFEAGKRQAIELRPFDVLTLDLTAARR
jgi:hypothetical protein